MVPTILIILGIVVLLGALGFGIWYVSTRSTSSSSPNIAKNVINTSTGGQGISSSPGGSPLPSPSSPGVYPIAYPPEYYASLHVYPTAVLGSSSSSQIFVSDPTMCTSACQETTLPYRSQALCNGIAPTPVATNSVGVWACVSSAQPGYVPFLTSFSGAPNTSASANIARLCRPTALSSTGINLDCPADMACDTTVSWRGLTYTAPNNESQFYGMCLPASTSNNQKPLLNYQQNLSQENAAMFNGTVWSTTGSTCVGMMHLSSSLTPLYMCQGPVINPVQVFPTICNSSSDCAQGNICDKTVQWQGSASLNSVLGNNTEYGMCLPAI